MAIGHHRVQELLNARGRHRRVHPQAPGRVGRAGSCSTPEGVIVGFTRRRFWSRSAHATAQRPRASSSGSRDRVEIRRGMAELLNARGRHRRVHIPGAGGRAREPSICSTPEGVIVGFTLTPRGPSPRAVLLNARGRHRRVHAAGPLHLGGILGCSTPEGVIVGFTARSCARRRPRRLLNARGRHRRVHGGDPVGGGAVAGPCSTPEGVIVGFTPATVSKWPIGEYCSTPEGVIVGFTPEGFLRRATWHDCSTPEGVIVGFTGRGEPVPSSPYLLNARGRHRRVHPEVIVLLMGENNCSTPEGVIVGFTMNFAGSGGGPSTAQRPRASSSGSRLGRRGDIGHPGLLNARGRHRRVHGTPRCTGG